MKSYVQAPGTTKLKNEIEKRDFNLFIVSFDLYATHSLKSRN